MVVKKPAAKKPAPAKKPAAKSSKVSRGEGYVCTVCGLSVTVDEECGCIDACDILCCGKPMKEKKAKTKTAAKAKAAR